MEDLAAQEPDIARAEKPSTRSSSSTACSRKLARRKMRIRATTRPSHSRDEAVAYGEALAKLDPAKPIAFAIQSSLEGDLPLTMIGVSQEPGVARALSSEHLDLLKPILEDARRVKVAHDVKALILALAKHGMEAQGFRHDVMLIRVPALRRSGGMLARGAGRTISGPQARSRSRAARRSRVDAGGAAGTRNRSGGFPRDLRKHRFAAGVGAGAHGANRHPDRAPRTEDPIRTAGRRHSAVVRRDSRTCRKAVQHQFARRSSAKYCSKS